MSALIYLASDTPLEELKSPHNRTMSVREALALGIELPDILNPDEIDRDDPDMLLWSDSYTENPETGILEDCGFDDDISILAMEGKTEDILTEKKYCASLQWPAYTKGRAERLITYIRDHLANASQIELWHIWMGQSYPPPRIHKTFIRMEELDTEAVRKLYECGVGELEPMAGRVRIEKEWNTACEELERDVYYCYVIYRSGNFF